MILLRFLLISLLAIRPLLALNVQELEEGAQAVAKVIDVGVDNMKETERIRFFQYSAYMEGFLMGVSRVDIKVRMANENFEPSTNQLAEKWMLDPEKSAKSLLTYINKNIPDSFNKSRENVTDVYFLVSAWYLSHHSKSTRLDFGLAADYMLLFTPDEGESVMKSEQSVPPKSDRAGG